MDLVVKRRGLFSEEYDLRNQTFKTVFRQMYLDKAVEKLTNNPFGYSLSLSTEVAEGIVDYNDKLMSNASAEHDEEPQTVELNGIGDSFNSMRNTTLLKITVDNADHVMDEVLLADLMPMPNNKLRVIEKHQTCFRGCLEELKMFMRCAATHSYSATVAFLGKKTDDGLMFGTGDMCVPFATIDQAIRKFALDKVDTCPQVIDIVYLEDKQSLLVNSIEANNPEKATDYFILRRGADDPPLQPPPKDTRAEELMMLSKKYPPMEFEECV